MKYGINTLDDFNFGGKTVFCRLDLNSPYDSTNDCLKDTTRISAAIPTIKELLNKGAKLILASHQGGDLEYDNFVSTSYHAKVISGLLSKQVAFIDDICGPAARDAIKNLKSGEVLLLDNVRYMAQEMTLFETKLQLTASDQVKTIIVQKISPLIDVYVCDAFAAAHRNQPTIVAFEYILASAMGRLFEKEYEVLSKIITDPAHPCIFVLGGAKIEDAFDMMPKVLSGNVADTILTSGLLGQLFYMAKGISLGKVSEDIIFKKKLNDYLDKAKDLLSKYPGKIRLPLDFAYIKDNLRCEFTADSLPSQYMIADIGSKTIDEYKRILAGAKTVFVNGPCGIFEQSQTETGTKELFCNIARSSAFSVIGGGDSIAAVNKYGLFKDFSYICTGGGAMVRFLSGEELPAVLSLKYSASKFGSF
jgi:phosphoglycerate kinase